MDGLAVLQAVAGRRAPAGSRELARELGLESTRVNRLVKTLAHLGVVAQGADRKYRPGPGIHVLAAQALFGSGLFRRAVPHLEALHGHGLVVAMGVLWQEQVSYLYHAEPGMPAADALGRQGLYPAWQSAIGVVLLAGVEARPHWSVAQRRQLEAVRQQGYALVPIDASAEQPRGHSLAVALPGVPSVGMALSGPIDDDSIDSLVAVLHAAANNISEQELST